MMENTTVMFSILLQGILYFVVVAAEKTENAALYRSSYFTTRENKRLVGYVFKRFNSPSLLSCGHQCVRNELCSSANFKVSTKENDKGTCELNKKVVNVNTKLLDEDGVTFLMFLEVNIS